jgi:hypothetical protein
MARSVVRGTCVAIKLPACRDLEKREIMPPDEQIDALAAYLSRLITQGQGA